LEAIILIDFHFLAGLQSEWCKIAVLGLHIDRIFIISNFISSNNALIACRIAGQAKGANSQRRYGSVGVPIAKTNGRL
jgi:hypothetical protein